MATERKSNVELLRIILMTLIVLWHFDAHGILHVLNNPDLYEINPTWAQLIIFPARCFAITCFVIISGYFGIKFSVQRFFNFSMQLLFYSILTFGIFLFLPEGKNHLQHFSITHLKFIYPANDTGWWFVSSYVLLMLVAPFLNAGIEKLTQKNLGIIIAIGLGVFLSGYHYYTNSLPENHMVFVYLYLLGRYIRLYPIKIIEKYSALIWVLAVAVMVGQTIYLYVQGELTIAKYLRIGNLTNPFNILSSVAFFYIFKRLDIGCIQLINWLATGVFAAYLMTEGYLRHIWNETIINIFGTNMLVLFFVALFSVLIFSCLDNIRAKIQAPIDLLLWNKLRQAYNKILTLSK